MALEDARHQVDMAFARPGVGGNRGPVFENTFAGATSFLRRRYSKDLTGVDLAVLGVPFDQAVTNRPGTRFGPRAIREASALQAPDAPYGWGFDPTEVLEIVDTGDLAFDYADLAAFPGTLQARVAEILRAGAGTLVLGGDHFVTLPILRAHAEALGAPLALIHFDAHTDTWADDNPARIDHGTFLYKAIREGVVDPAATVSVGIRTDNPDTMGVTIVDAPAVHRISPETVAQEIIEVVGARPCYLSFDIDCLDPAFAPGTGTPVWGGLASWQAAQILKDLRGVNLLGGDVVEVSPPYDTTGATAIAGAHVAVEIACLYAATRRAAP